MAETCSPKDVERKSEISPGAGNGDRQTRVFLSLVAALSSRSLIGRTWQSYVSQIDLADLHTCLHGNEQKA